MKIFFIGLIVFSFCMSAAAKTDDVPVLTKFVVGQVSQAKASCGSEAEPRIVLPGCLLTLRKFENQSEVSKVYANAELCDFKVGASIELASRKEDCDVVFGLRCEDYKNSMVEHPMKVRKAACLSKNPLYVTAYRKASKIKVYREQSNSFENFVNKK